MSMIENYSFDCDFYRYFTRWKDNYKCLYGGIQSGQI